MTLRHINLCSLMRDTDGIWRGRWLNFERMPIELIPLIGAGDYCFLRLEESGPSLARRLHRIASLRPKFFCINDDRRGDSTNDIMVMQYKAFLHWYFRRPSSFKHPEGCYSIISGHA